MFVCLRFLKKVTDDRDIYTIGRMTGNTPESHKKCNFIWRILPVINRNSP